ncbi:similar to Alcohol dehydrogenase GroES domain protein [Botrytis cinerea T4]|nr:similar to Alcohol dehydrogenase GroES domain protein [Botrytis cinerea T4]
MKALTWKSLGEVALVEKPRPALKLSTDAIVRVTHASICGTDVHVRDGYHPESEFGRVLGHEGVGFIEEIGESVEGFAVGDRVIVSCITVCSQCENCKRGMPGHCLDGGWQLGNTLDGLQAEYTRIPYATHSLHQVPPNIDEKTLVLLSEGFSSGYECGVLSGKVEPGCTVAVIGNGPVGLAAIITAQLYSPVMIIGIDIDDNRLRIASGLGADHTINASTDNVAEIVRSLTNGRGCDTVIEAVGLPDTIDMAQDIVAIGGKVANIGVHKHAANMYLNKNWAPISTGLVNATSTPLLVKMSAANKMRNPGPMFTHTFAFSEIEQGYKTFCNGKAESAIKLLIEF